MRTRGYRERAERSAMSTVLRRAGHDVHPSARIARGVQFRVPKVTVGPRTGIGSGTVFKGAGTVAIGSYCSLSERVVAITSDHRNDGANVLLTLHGDLGWASAVSNIAEVKVGCAVFLGDRVTLLPGVSVGHGAICATGSVVTRDVAPFSVVAGVPARQLRMRFSPDVIEVLLETAWWDWQSTRIARNREFFEADLTKLDAAGVRALIQD